MENFDTTSSSWSILELIQDFIANKVLGVQDDIDNAMRMLVPEIMVQEGQEEEM